MTWAKVDDGFLDHPKVLRAGEEAANLYLRGLIWCNKHLTDGHIPREALRALSMRRDLGALACKLVAVGLWETTPDGWYVHDFAAHNPLRADVEAKRQDLSQKRAEAGKRGGLRSGEVRGVEAKVKQLASPVASSLLKQNEAPSRPVPSGETHTLPAREETPPAAPAVTQTVEAESSAPRAPPPKAAAPRPVDDLVAAGGIVAPDLESARLLNDAMCIAGITCNLAAQWGRYIATEQGRKVCWPWLRSPETVITATFLRSCDLTRGEEVYVRLRDGFSAWRNWHTRQEKAREKAAPKPVAPPLATPPVLSAEERRRAAQAAIRTTNRTTQETPSNG